MSNGGVDATPSGEALHDHFLDKVGKWMMDYRGRAIDVFRQFDANGDGVLTHDEFRTGLRQLRAPLTEDEIALLVDYMDKDGDGTIDYFEFQRGIVYGGRAKAISDDDEAELEEVDPGRDLWRVGREPPPRYVRLEMKLGHFAGRSHPCHVTLTVTTVTSVYGVGKMVNEYFGGVFRNLGVFSDASCAPGTYLGPGLTLEDCGFTGGSSKRPETGTLYYDYTPEFTDCPLLMNDTYFGTK